MKTVRHLIATFVALLAVCLPADAAAATKHYCRCDTGAAVGCVAGNDANDGSTPALAKLTFTQWMTDASAGAAGDQFKGCEGGFWDGVSKLNFSNANATAGNPIIIGHYDATAVWSGGSGIAPVWQNTASTTIFSAAQGSISATRHGYTLQGIKITGGGTNNSNMVVVSQATSNVTFDGVTIDGSLGTGLFCNGGSTSVPSGSDGLSEHFTFENGAITNNHGIGLLTSCNDTLIENNTFDHNGSSASGTDHHVYIGGDQVAIAAPTISTIVGDGSTVTVTTVASHNLSSTLRQCATISGVTGGTGTWAITCGLAGSGITVTGPTTFTYAATANGTGSGGSITSIRQVVPAKQAVVRGNTMTNADVSTAGSCKEAAIVVHGDWTYVEIAYNSISEPTVPASSSCWGIAADSGGYSPPEDRERLTSIVIRGNTVLNYALGIGCDISVNCFVENNYVYSTFSTGAFGIVAPRDKNFTPSAQYSGTATSGTSTTMVDLGANFASNVSQVKITGGTGSGQARVVSSKTSTQLTVRDPWTITPDATSTYVTTQSSGRDPLHQAPATVTVRYNTVYLTAPNAASWGIAQNCNIADDVCASGLNLYGNEIVLGSTATTSTMCLNTANLSSSAWATKDYNGCHYLGASVPKWENTSTLATIQATGLDTHSAITASTSATADQPFLTAPTTSPATSVSTSLVGAGYPSLKPYGAWGGVKRAQATTDRGAYERGAATVIPLSQTRISVQ